MTDPRAELPLNARVTVTVDGAVQHSHAYMDSLYAKATLRISADELRAALERGHLELAVEISPLQVGEFL